MPGPHLTTTELADEFGRTRHWMYANWQRLVSENKLPPPIADGVWCRAQVYAYLDTPLPREMRAATAAYRAAFAAAHETQITGSDSINDAAWADRLSQSFRSDA